LAREHDLNDVAGVEVLDHRGGHAGADRLVLFAFALMLGDGLRDVVDDMRDDVFDAEFQ
jgi:hypothetical protein